MRAMLDCVERLERERERSNISDLNSRLLKAGLFASGNPWEFPPAAVVADGLESIWRYYHTWEQCGFGLVEIHALKVVLVGSYGAGKTR